MGNFRKFARWLWDGWGNVLWLVGLIASFALPAWATRVTGVFSHYAPLSWVVAGFLGMGVGVSCMAVFAWAKGKLTRARYDIRMLGLGGAVDPLAKTFERRRIYLNEFCLPSNPYIADKTFIECEIIGPANVILMVGNNVSDHRLPICDAMVLASGADPVNGYVFSNCVFRGCSFQRITLMFTVEEYHNALHVNWLRWTSLLPDQQIPLALEAGEQTSVQTASPSGGTSEDS